MAGKTVYVKRRGSLLIPTAAEQEEILRTLPSERWLKATLVQERSVKQNAFFHALCNEIAKAMNEAGDDTATAANIKSRILMAIGHADLYRLPRALQRRFGTEYAVRERSINFNEVDGLEFNEIMTRVTRFVLLELLPHLPLNIWTKNIEARLVHYGLPPTSNAA